MIRVLISFAYPQVVPHPMLAPWVVEFIGECAAFPAGANDDQVDAWSQGAKRLLRVKAKPPASSPQPYYSSIGASDRSWMV
jgi:hypothetical protein